MTTLRTLVIAEGLPYPPCVGKDLRSWQNIHGLTKISEVGVFGLHSKDLRSRNEPPLRLAFWRSSIDPAISYQLQKETLAARAWHLDPLGHPADLYYSDTAASEIAEIMANFKPQIVVIEGLWLYRYIELLKQFRCRVVLDCHNVEAMVYEEIADATHGDDLPSRLIRKILPVRTKTVEQNAIQQVDQVWVCSENDARLMRNLYGETAASHVVPNVIDAASYRMVRTRQYPRPEGVNPHGKVLIFPALFGYIPNDLAASFLITRIFPRLTDDFADCQLLLAGGKPTSEMMAAAQLEPRIVVTGAVTDMRAYLAAAFAMVVPLLQGGGTRFKILEAFAANLPVISTAKGAEGLAVQDETHLLIAETVDEFIAAFKRIWADGCLRERLTANAIKLVNQTYSLSAASAQIAKALL